MRRHGRRVNGEPSTVRVKFQRIDRAEMFDDARKHESLICLSAARRSQRGKNERRNRIPRNVREVLEEHRGSILGRGAATFADRLRRRSLPENTANAAPYSPLARSPAISANP